ncbi:hypothetical protein HN709_05025 [Candidatus Peregrinibacteria bacterium]|jgi:hypothetical protein|nr:hypothetical protein [Candidatus Peregrinibacteria bacterium]MBT7737025.1 hypothetical protein [Candidatus Peregrinibacteria bacterium]
MITRLDEPNQEVETEFNADDYKHPKGAHGLLNYVYRLIDGEVRQEIDEASKFIPGTDELKDRGIKTASYGQDLIHISDLCDSIIERHHKRLEDRLSIEMIPLERMKEEGKACEKFRNLAHERLDQVLAPIIATKKMADKLLVDLYREHYDFPYIEPAEDSVEAQIRELVGETSDGTLKLIPVDRMMARNKDTRWDDDEIHRNDIAA